MEYKRLGKSGLQLSVLSLGSWLTFGKQISDATAEKLMATAYDQGVNFFDNAEIYARGKSEIVMGKYLGKFPKGTRLSMEGLDWLKERSLTQERLDKTADLNDLALELDTSLAKLAVAWCAKKPNVTTVILGASKIKHLKETLSALEDIRKITPEVDERIEGILNNKPKHPAF